MTLADRLTERLPDIRLGAIRGIAIGGAFALARTAAHLRGAAGLDSQEPALWRWILLFLLGGASAGAIAGLLGRFAHRRIDAVWVGIVATIPLGVGGDILIFDGSPIAAQNVISAAIWCLLMGSMGGLFFHWLIERQGARGNARNHG